VANVAPVPNDPVNSTTTSLANQSNMTGTAIYIENPTYFRTSLNCLNDMKKSFHIWW